MCLYNYSYTNAEEILYSYKSMYIKYNYTYMSPIFIIVRIHFIYI